ncbi:zinc finger protein 862-like isoform X1 [Neoarius graeffei]|uniref:zinc finger protein 862-like isoform X1 n=1 Tax=Neoarius graeffei TaxID=443677 RepID=UPI00298CB45B|nr:zinc finger protein 862-like isoform X1 [Neoarius graeffei]
MIGQIADLLKESLTAQLRTAKYLAVLIDGDTDISNTECEIVYVRLVEGGKPVTLLVGQQALEHSHAIGVLDATKAAFSAVYPEDNGGSWLAKLISFGADGASVNMGHRGGVIALLQREAGEHIIPIHCMPHRLELAILTLQKKEPMVCQVYDLLHLVWKTYHFSGKSKRALHQLGQELGVKVCTPSTVKGTRWIPHVHRALKVFLRYGTDTDLATGHGQYSIVLQHMEHLAVAGSVEIQGRAKQVKRGMESALFCVFCHFLADVFEELSSFSLTLQRKDLILPQATSELKKTVTRLEAFKSRAKSGGMLEKIQAMLAQHGEEDECRFQGISLKGNLTGLADFTHPQLKKHVESAINICVSELKDRFGGLLDDGADVRTPVQAFKVFNHDTWPDDHASLLTFGDEDVAELVAHFREPLSRSGCDLAAVQNEWQGLKILVSQHFKDKHYSGLWETMLTKEPYREDYKNILELVHMMLVLPISAAQCERGFSAQNRIKNSKRSCLAVSTTEDLMRISLEGPSLEDFDPSPAVDRWMDSAKRSRRPDYKIWERDIVCV